jgi:hypothetical protein
MDVCKNIWSDLNGDIVYEFIGTYSNKVENSIIN